MGETAETTEMEATVISGKFVILFILMLRRKNFRHRVQKCEGKTGQDETDWTGLTEQDGKEQD